MQATKTQRKQPVQKRSQITCDAIVEATIQVLLRDGAARLTTTRVAERAGVSVGTLYQYYPNKSALIEAVRARYFGLMSAAVQKIIGQGTDENLEQVMDQALTAVIEMKRQNLPLSRALAELPGDPDQPDFAAEVVGHFAEFILPLISPDAPPTDAQRSHALATMAALEGLLSYAVKNAPDWLGQPWFLARSKALAHSGLSDPPTNY
ncbi:TetR/AcrR family transcriptional regulator [Yoonia sp. R2-816]